MALCCSVIHQQQPERSNMRKLIGGSVLCVLRWRRYRGQMTVTQGVDQQMQALPALRISVGGTAAIV